jgi:hypothetical protein
MTPPLSPYKHTPSTAVHAVALVKEGWMDGLTLVALCCQCGAPLHGPIDSVVVVSLHNAP